MSDEVLRNLLDTMKRFNRENRPPLKSVTVNPLDYEDIRAHAAVVATTPEKNLRFGPLEIWGVPILVSPWVRRGQPWYDPPESAPQVRSVATEDK